LKGITHGHKDGLKLQYLYLVSQKCFGGQFIFFKNHDNELQFIIMINRGCTIKKTMMTSTIVIVVVSKFATLKKPRQQIMFIKVIFGGCKIFLNHNNKHGARHCGFTGSNTKKYIRTMNWSSSS
jgi:hypothetical protein